MEQIIFSLIIVLICSSAVVFALFVINNLKKINTKIEGIPKHYWSMAVYMDNIPQNEQNVLHLGSVPLKIYEKGEYSEIAVPHIGEEVGGVYYSGQHKFSMEGIVTNVHYNTDLDLIVVSCKCTEIRKNIK